MYSLFFLLCISFTILTHASDKKIENEVLDLQKKHHSTRKNASRNYAVRKGDAVTVKFSKKNLIIEMQGVALRNTNLGAVLRVKIIDSNKILSGKLIDHSTVLVS